MEPKMTVIAIVLSVFGLGFLCWLLFTLAVYALPFFIAVTAGLWAYHSGAGALGAVIVAILAGASTFVVGQAAFTATRSPVIRGAIALLFAVPAAIAGYHATFALAGIGLSGEGWRVAFGVIGALFVGGTAWARLTLFDTAGPGQGFGTHRVSRDGGGAQIA
jgi:hypothetical protein